MQSTATPPVVERNEHDRLLAQQVEVEKQLTWFGDRVSARRRRLPMTPIEDYALTGADGDTSLRDPFGPPEGAPGHDLC